MDFASIKNYYEDLVFDYMFTNLTNNNDNNYNEDLFLDIACYALTRLPSRYIRHPVDMAFYLKSDERLNMTKEVEKAVQEAIQHMENNSKRN
ncbi:MAG: late competence development ComFB family protein [Gammaproteobacteria bacterium]|nr:late competence development ComFB family protein [Gammaproteobacteria bacterium]